MHDCVPETVLDALHVPVTHVKDVTVHLCVPCVLQGSPVWQLPHPSTLVPQLVPLGAYPLTGQALLEPLQDSATSQLPEEARQGVPALAAASAGQAAAVPVQDSATSHTPPEARHWVPLATNPSGGHVAALPVQDSATSHTPAEARHTVIAGLRLQLFVDTLGLHCWQSPLGLVAPAA